MTEPEFRIVITPTRDGFHFKSPEHQAEVIRHLTAEALGQLSAPVQVRVVPAERIEGPSRFTATPAQIDAFLRTHFCEDRILLYQWAIGDAAAHEAAEEIRTDAQAKYDRDFSDNRIFHLNGSKWGADLIDPAKGGGHYPSVLVSFAAPTGPIAVLPPCRCGYDRARHDPDQCRDCPGDKERSWKHPYTPGLPTPA